MPSAVAHNLSLIRQQIAQSAAAADRPPGSITLVAVSKGHAISAIEEAITAGQFAFGENYLQEALKKIKYFSTLSTHPLQWHFIGRLQKNKIRQIAQNFNWLHTLNSLENGQLFSRYRPAWLPSLHTLIQVNLSGDRNRYGVVAEDLADLSVAVAALPNLKLRGFMVAPPPLEEQHLKEKFHEIRRLFSHMQQQLPDLDTLSMGISSDFTMAIYADSTLLRIGSAIFGPRGIITNRDR